MWEEDVITDRLNENFCRERMIKYRDVVSFNQEMKKIDPSFKQFYLKEEYWSKLDKCVEKFDKISAEVPKEIKKNVDSK